MKHTTSQLSLPTGEEVLATAPVIVSASRATDIPAFYLDWFMHRFDQGYLKWRNPFSGQSSYVSFCKTKFIVFWSKNPHRLIDHIDSLQRKDIGFYIQYTLNDYAELETNLPSLQERIHTFQYLSDKIGKDALIWRFDPMVLTDSISVEDLLRKIQNIADQLHGYTNKLVFSYADISSYKKVERNLKAAGINYQEWTADLMLEFAEKLADMNSKRWKFDLATCAESINLEPIGIAHNSCIDAKLISRLRPNDRVLQNFLTSCSKDKGQRKQCGCILSKDIGTYNTCPHGCVYCYANSNPEIAIRNFGMYQNNIEKEIII